MFSPTDSIMQSTDKSARDDSMPVELSDDGHTSIYQYPDALVQESASEAGAEKPTSPTRSHLTDFVDSSRKKARRSSLVQTCNTSTQDLDPSNKEIEASAQSLNDSPFLDPGSPSLPTYEALFGVKAEQPVSSTRTSLADKLNGIAKGIPNSYSIDFDGPLSSDVLPLLCNDKLMRTSEYYPYSLGCQAPILPVYESGSEAEAKAREEAKERFHRDFSTLSALKFIVGIGKDPDLCLSADGTRPQRAFWRRIYQILWFIVIYGGLIWLLWQSCGIGTGGD